MSIIIADDFQQWATAASYIKGAGLYPQYLGQNVPSYMNEISCFGIFTPSYGMGYGGQNTVLYTLYYDTTRGALCAVQPRSSAETQAALASGYRRKISYEGDTLYFGTTLEFGGVTPLYNGDFLIFGNNPDGVVFTQQDQVGTYLYGVGIDADGFYTFNGVSTTVQAYYKPATVLCYFDVIFGPDYMELWINNVMALRQTRQNIPIKEFGITAGKLVKTTGANFCIWIHSVIGADNSGGFGQRIGRKRVKTEQIKSVVTVESTPQVSGASTPLQLINRFATEPTTDFDTVMLGNLGSPNGYVKNEFGVVRDSAAKKPYGALVAIQAKRLSPSGDGLSIVPYTIINGAKVLGNIFRTSSTWKMYYTETPIAEGQTFTAATLGYMHDYKDLNKIYADDRTKVEVYGDKTTDLSTDVPWAKPTDLMAFDSTNFRPNGFSDYTGKNIQVVGPTVAANPFQYGTGINMNEGGYIALVAGQLPANTFTKAWTLDYWAAETINGAVHSLWPITYSGGSVNDRILLGVHDTSTTRFALWNNGANARDISTWLAPTSNTAWRHWAFVYDGAGILRVFLDGVLQGTLSWTILQSSALFCTGSRVLGTAARAAIERYRLRAGAAWVSNFNVDGIYN